MECTLAQYIPSLHWSCLSRWQLRSKNKLLYRLRVVTKFMLHWATLSYIPVGSRVLCSLQYSPFVLGSCISTKTCTLRSTIQNIILKVQWFLYSQRQKNNIFCMSIGAKGTLPLHITSHLTATQDVFNFWETSIVPYVPALHGWYKDSRLQTTRRGTPRLPLAAPWSPSFGNEVDSCTPARFHATIPFHSKANRKQNQPVM